MLRIIFSKVAWVGKATSFAMGSVIMAALLVGAAATAAEAAKARSLRLGVSNTVADVTSMVGSVAGPVLRLDNNGAGPALDLRTEAGQAPMTVDSDTEVANLRAATATSADSADNADKLDGQDSSGFLGTFDKAINSDRLDNKDSTEFLQGNGTARAGAVAMSPTFAQTILTLENPDLHIIYNCPQNLTQNGVLVITNRGSETLNMFSDNGSANPIYQQLDPFNTGQFFYSQGAAAGGDLITFGVQGATVATIHVFSVHRGNDCHAQAQALVTR